MKNDFSVTLIRVHLIENDEEEGGGGLIHCKMNVQNVSLAGWRSYTHYLGVESPWRISSKI